MSDTIPTLKVRKCPFCGSSALFRIQGKYYLLHEDDCFIQGTTLLNSPNHVAFKRWNTRVK